MAADASRLVDVRATLPPDEQGRVFDEYGSGLLVTDDLVLTAAHVVFDDDDRPLPVALRFPASETTATGTVVWPGHRGDTDAALVRITGATPPPSVGRAPRWGRFTGREARQSIDATGFPRVMLEDGRRVSYQLSGHINPQGALREGRYLLSVADPPADPGVGKTSPWAGMSGASAMCGGAVVGVIVIDTPGWDRDLLTVVPAAEIAADPQARALLGVSGPPVSVELDPLLARPAVSHGRLSPAQLLRADEEVIPFLGREHELNDLIAWCASPDEFGARLIAGPGGRGKTRLAQALVDQIERVDGQWISGLLSSSISFSSDLGAVMSTAREHPVLLVADYAESRGGQLDRLLWDYEAADNPPRLRLLLLARDRGEWWDRLSDRHPMLLGDAAFLSLTPLHPLLDRDAAFTACVEQFASRLAGIRPGVDWAAIGAAIAGSHDARDLRDERFGDPLALQLEALLALLESASATGPGEAPELRLIAHEREYWRSTLEAEGLDLAPRLRDQAVAAATLIAARDRPGALALLQRVPELTNPGPVATWLRSLYPTEAQSRYWGPLQPDRLGEHHIGAVTRDDPALLRHLLGSEDVNELQEALVIIGRAMAHQPHLQQQVGELLKSGPPLLVEAANRAADRVANPLPLLRAVPGSVGQRYTLDPDDYGSVSSWSHGTSVPEKLSEIGRGIGENPYTSSRPLEVGPETAKATELREAWRDLPPSPAPVAPPSQPASVEAPAGPSDPPLVRTERQPERPLSRRAGGLGWLTALLFTGVIVSGGILVAHQIQATPAVNGEASSAPPLLVGVLGLLVLAIVAAVVFLTNRLRGGRPRPSSPATGGAGTVPPAPGVPPGQPAPVGPPVSPGIPPPTGLPSGDPVERGREHERLATEAYERGNLVLASHEFATAVAIFRDPAVAHEHLTRCLLGHAAVLNDRRVFAQASAAIDEAVSILSSEVAHGAIPADVLGRARDLQGGILAEMGELERALSCGYDAVRILREADSGPTASWESRRDYGKAVSNLAGLMQRTGRIREALSLSAEAVTIFEGLQQAGLLGPGDATYGRVILGHARIMSTAAGPQGGLEQVDRAIAEFERIGRADADSMRAMAPELASAHSLRSILHAQLGDRAAAIASGIEAVKSYEELADLVPGFLPDLATSLVNLANLRLEAGQAASALEGAQRAVELLHSVLKAAGQTGTTPSASITRFLSTAEATLARARSAVWSQEGGTPAVLGQ